MNTIKLFACVAVALTALTSTADEGGPKSGEKVPALKAFGITGSVEGKAADFAAVRKDAPTIYIFVKAEERGIPVGGRPAARFMKELDKNLNGASDKAAVVAVWLGEKAFEKHKEYLPRFQMSLKLEHTSLAAFDGDVSGPNGWAVNSDSHLTVVVTNKGKVAKSFAFGSVNETDVKPVLEALRKAVK